MMDAKSYSDAIEWATGSSRHSRTRIAVPGAYKCSCLDCTSWRHRPRILFDHGSGRFPIEKPR